MNMKRVLLLSAIVIGASVNVASAQFPTLTGKPPLVIGHRGASGYLPEHTLESYARAIQLGANFIEPDLVSTSDGVLVARHEPMLSGTTNVADLPQFASRRNHQGRGRRAHHRLVRERFHPGGDQDAPCPSAVGQPSAGVQRPVPDPHVRRDRLAGAGRGRRGLPGNQAPDVPRRAGPLPRRADARHAHRRGGGTAPTPPVFIQSFESSNLRQLNTMTQIKLVQLVDANDVNADGSLDLTAPYDRPYDFTVAGDPRTFADLLTAEGLDFVNDYADGIGPWKPYLLTTAIFDPNGDGVAEDRNGDGVVDVTDRILVGDSGVITAAHLAGAAGARVHLPQRLGAVRLRGSDGRVPRVLRAGDRRRVQRLPRHRARRDPGAGVRRAPGRRRLGRDAPTAPVTFREASSGGPQNGGVTCEPVEQAGPRAIGFTFDQCGVITMKCVHILSAAALLAGVRRGRPGH